MAGYEWRENPACTATYNLLGGDRFLDQFEAADTPFNEAGKLTLDQLQYFLTTTGNQRLIQGQARRIARKFLQLVVETYTVDREIPGTSEATIFFDTAEVFGDGSKTLTDIAGVLDKHIRFPAEAVA